MPKSNYLAAAVIGHVFGKSTYSPPTTFYLALCKTVPSPSDTGSTINEVTYTNYARKAFISADLAAVVAQTIASNDVQGWPAPGNVGDTANGWAVCDASSGGNMLWYNTLPTTVIAANGAAPSIASGSLTFSEA